MGRGGEKPCRPLPSAGCWIVSDVTHLSRERLRVTLVSLEWPGSEHVGGVGRYAYRLANELKALVDLTVLTFDGAEPIEGVRFVTLPRPRGRFERYYKLPFRVRNAVHQLGGDVVHAFGDDWALRKAHSVKIVRTFHGSAWGEAKSSSGLRRVNHVVLAALEQLASMRADVKIAVGPDSMKEFRCQYLMPPVSRVRVTGAERSAHPRVVFIGSHEGRKRGYLAERAASEAARAIGREVSLDVVGPPDDAGRWSLAGTSHHANASDAEVAELIERAWLLVAPSSYEGFGIPMYEGLALGTGVVVTTNPGARYIASIAEDINTRAFTLAATEHEFIRAVEERLDLGPLRSTDAEDAQAIAEKIRHAGSAARLVADLY